MVRKKEQLMADIKFFWTKDGAAPLQKNPRRYLYRAYQKRYYPAPAIGTTVGINLDFVKRQDPTGFIPFAPIRWPIFSQPLSVRWLSAMRLAWA